MSRWKRERRRMEREAWERRQEERAGAPDDRHDEPHGGYNYDRYGRRRRERGPFRRYPERAVAAGVVAGVARWLGWRTWALRGPSIAFLVINPPLFLAIYFTLWAVMERETVLAWFQRQLPSLPDAVPHSTVEDVHARLKHLEGRAAQLEARVTSDAFALRRRFQTLD